MRCPSITRGFCLLSIVSLAAIAYADDPAWIARSTTGMVASDSPEASEIGAAVLRDGGNAFDAAVATSFALGVARSHSTGLGGGGFMVAYIAADKRFVVLDFREMAPAAATPERYTKLASKTGDGPSPSIFGGNAIGVPGQVAGLVEIAERYGTMPLSTLAEPAAKLAEAGFLVDKSAVSAAKDACENRDKWPEFSRQYAAFYRQILPAGELPELGQRVPNPQLARTLRLIGQRGKEAFYEGEIADAIIAAVRAAGGDMTRADLRGYAVKQRMPFMFTYYHPFDECTYRFVTMPPPSSGGVALAEFFKILRLTYLRSDLHPELDREHVLIEALKHVFADRARWLGDPDFCKIPLDELLSDEHAIACQIAYRRTLPIEEYGLHAPPKDDRGTSHFSVADRHGNIVAITETINGTFGSYVVAKPFGILLNNQIDDFLTVRGQENLFGLVQSEANLVAPGKRPLSSMTPTIIFRNDKPFLTLGASGGPRIITSTLQVALNCINGQSIEEAMTALRVHHQWQPNEVYFDREPPAKVVELLRARGHQIAEKHRSGVVQAIRFLDDGTMVGACDPKKGGAPAGP